MIQAKDKLDWRIRMWIKINKKKCKGLNLWTENRNLNKNREMILLHSNRWYSTRIVKLLFLLVYLVIITIICDATSLFYVD